MPRVSPHTPIARRARKDERGAILVLGAVGLLVALVASALAVDLGRQSSEKKADQLVADLAALDSVRELEPLLLSVPGVTLPITIADAQQAAEDAARRNGFDPDAAGNDVVAETGTVDSNNTFTAGGATPNAVKVTVSSLLDYLFEVGGRTLSASAVARLIPDGSPGTPGTPGIPPTNGSPGGGGGGTTPTSFAGFDLGSALASADFDNTSVPVLNRIFGEMIDGNADLMSWKGLGDANVTMAALGEELGALGLDVGTPQKLMAADLTLNQLFTATANALNQQGTSDATAAAALFGGSAGIIAQSTNTTTFKLAKIMTFNQGGGSNVADANLKVRNLIVGAAQVANGSNVISIPNIGINLPGIATTALTLQIVEPMKHVFGPVGAWAETAQVKLTITPTIDDGLPNLPLLSEPKIVGSFPIDINAAGARGTIVNIDCSPTAPALNVGVLTRPVTAAGAATLKVTQRLPAVPFVSPAKTVDVLNVPTASTMPSIAERYTDLPFAYSTEFHPFWDGSKRAGTYPINLAGSTVTLSGPPQVLTIPLALNNPPFIQSVTDRVLQKVRDKIAVIENQVVSKVIKSLGMNIGVADVTATDHMCTAGNPPTSTPPTGGTPGTPGTPGTVGTPSAGGYKPVLVG
ncbi:MAG: hypothetical protein QOG87_4246 [Actinomycetota bacterium]|jgi:uncharacterized membrane protein